MSITNISPNILDQIKIKDYTGNDILPHCSRCSQCITEHTIVNDSLICEIPLQGPIPTFTNPNFNNNDISNFLHLLEKD